jgi:hypothetical protein
VRSEALLALIQTELFESIINLQEAGAEGLSDADRVGLLSKAAKNSATLARASVTVKKFQREVRERAKAAAAAVEAMAKQGGMSPEMVEMIRRNILGIPG